ncbi:MAG: NADH-quinone oxidoreductase subunit N [Candidatus Eisenbacteria bacterium]
MTGTVLGNGESLRYFLPELILVGTILAVIAFELIAGRKESGALPPETGRRSPVCDGTLAIGIAGVAGALAALLSLGYEGPLLLFEGAIAWDPFSVFFRCFFLAVTAAILLIAHPYRPLVCLHYGEFVSLVIGTAFGMILLASSTNLLLVYLALETVSLPSYILAGFLRGDRKSSEAALKYAVYGAAASGAMLYGLSFLYGMTGSINFFEMREALLGAEIPVVHLLVPIVFVLAGFGYKIAAVPFHMWAPDVYEGSATPITAFFSVGPKASGLAVLIRFFHSVFAAGEGSSAQLIGSVDWTLILAIVSAITMTLGNLAAIGQENLKRMLAYSSIAHAGTMLMGAVVLGGTGVQAVLFYLVVYAFMNLGAFLVVIALSVERKRETIADFRGLGWKMPFLGVAMTVFLLSLTGVPPTAGFVAKFAVLRAVIEKEIYWLAVVGVLNTVVSLYYYARVIKAMFLDAPAPGETALPALSWIHLVLIALFLVPTALFGFRFGLLDALTAASRFLVTGS